jgi:toxin HigB-1
LNSGQHSQVEEKLLTQELLIRFAVYRSSVYNFTMILSFADQETADLFAGLRVKRFVNIAAVAQRKLQMLDCAATLDALRVPPGNRLEALVADRSGQHSIRINDQWRLCFVWTADGVHDVQIVDYH